MKLGIGELFLVFALVLLMFGPKKLPELARSMGEAMKEFKKGQKEIDETISKSVVDEEEDRDKETK